MRADAEHCSFVLLADFDIDRGAQLTYQFPQPLGTDEGCVAFTSGTLYSSHRGSKLQVIGKPDASRWCRTAT